MKTDIYTEITNRIIAELENGVIPWHQSWRPVDWRPKNLISGKPYRGINTLLLALSKYKQPFWLTFNQLQKLGGKLKHGQKPTMVVFWRFFDTDDKKSIPMLRKYYIFNLEQTYGVPNKYIPQLLSQDSLKFQPIENAENMLAMYEEMPKIIHGGNSASYSPAYDLIRMPSRGAFDNEEGYYATLFHECIHSTGHHKRLKRHDMKDMSFGNETYSKEELIAEIGAAFLCAESGIENATIKNSAAYIKNWLEQLKNHKKMLLQAAAAAQKAVDYMLNQNKKELME